MTDDTRTLGHNEALRERDLLAFSRGWEAALTWMTPGATLIGFPARVLQRQAEMVAARARTAEMHAALNAADTPEVRRHYRLHPYGQSCTSACRGSR